MRTLVSIVTPSFNQAPFLEETLCSVLGQTYPGIQYIVMDGGSADESPRILERFASRLHYWQSQPDGGHSAAINQGFSRSTGQILGWINSDDFYLPGAVAHAVSVLDPTKPQLLIANCLTLTEGSGKGSLSRVSALHECSDLALHDYVIQPSAFWTRRAWEQAGLLDTSLTYAFDWDFFIRLKRAGAQILTSNSCLSVYRVHAAHKSSSGSSKRAAEIAEVYRRYKGPRFAQLFTFCSGRREPLQYFQKRLKGVHLSEVQGKLLRLRYPEFRGFTDPEINQVLRML